MKKIILIIFMCVLLPVIFCTGCKTLNDRKVIYNEYQDTTINTSLFIVVQECETYSIVYHKDTKVMYSVSKSTYNCGNFTLLVDCDGLPLMYGG